MAKYIICAIYVLFSVSGLTLIKLGSMQSEGPGITIAVIDLYLSKLSFWGIMCYGISFCLYIGAVSKFDLGFIIPLLGGVVNIAILIISYFILKEKLSVNMIVGAVFIIIGIVIMNIKKTG